MRKIENRTCRPQKRKDIQRQPQILKYKVGRSMMYRYVLSLGTRGFRCSKALYKRRRKINFKSFLKVQNWQFFQIVARLFFPCNNQDLYMYMSELWASCRFQGMLPSYASRIFVTFIFILCISLLLEQIKVQLAIFFNVGGSFFQFIKAMYILKLSSNKKNL